MNRRRSVARIWKVAVVAAALLVIAGCGGARLSTPLGDAVPDPSAFAASLRDASLPATPEQYTFAWTLDEQGSRVRGRGVVRTEEAERIRLDLFGARGETYLIAALVEDEYRLPPSAENAATLPTPSVLWAGLGILKLPPDATLSSATASESAADLRYESPGGQIFAYTFERDVDDGFRLARLERASRQGVLETVSVERDASGAITRTHYRDWTAFRDLELVVQSVQTASSFPSNIWRPDEAAR